jgi:hypothetical protein
VSGLSQEWPNDGPPFVSIPIRAGGLVKLSDLRDIIEATSDASEEDVLFVSVDELRWEAS